MNVCLDLDIASFSDRDFFQARDLFFLQRFDHNLFSSCIWISFVKHICTCVLTAVFLCAPEKCQKNESWNSEISSHVHLWISKPNVFSINKNTVIDLAVPILLEETVQTTDNNMKEKEP